MRKQFSKKLPATNRAERKINSVFKMLLWGLLLSLGTMAKAQTTVTGTVTDQLNEPVIGANVSIKGTTTGTVTDLDGQYSVQVPNEQSVLVFSYLGYATQELTVGTRTTIHVKMEESSQMLGEVVVSVGYQTQKKVNLTGAVTSVSSEAFENKPVSNVGQALQGLVPNLNVSIENGAPNKEPTFNLRGVTSMNSSGTSVSGSPLILIDGIEAGATNLNMLNPNDIESFNIIKDASAAAIYGTRANNGVIIVTTKTGKFNQKAQISYSYDIRWKAPSAEPDILSSDVQFLAGIYNSNLRNWGKRGNYKELTTTQQRELDGLLKYQANPTPENAWMYTTEGATSGGITWLGNMNPYKVAVRDWAPVQQHSLSVSGGSNSVTYYVSLGYTDEEGMYKINTDEYKRISFLANVTAKLTDRLSLTTKVSQTRTDYKTPFVVGGKGSVWTAMRNEPGRNIRMPLMSGPDDPQPNTWTDNILGWLAYGAKQRTIGESAYYTISPSYKVLPGLTLKGDLSYRPRTEDFDQLTPKRQYVAGSWTLSSTHATNNMLTKTRQKTELFTINLYADFNKTFAKKHTVSGVIGFNQESYMSKKTGVNATYLITPDLESVQVSSESKQAVTDSGTETASRGVFGRVNYNFSDRYLFEVNGRYDGSSKFTKGERYKFFPSFSAAWRISEESFMENTRSWLNNLKLRGGYGVLGSQPSSNYPFASTLKYGALNYYMNGGKIVQVYAPNDLVASALKWETTANLNIGLDAMMLGNRLEVVAEVFERRTKDILMGGAEYPAILAVAPPLVNSGELKTYGWEFFLTWRDKLANGLRYDVTLSIADSQTKVISFPANDENQTIGTIYGGAKFGNIWGYETDRLFQEDDFDANGKLKIEHDQSALGANWYPGDVKYKDLDGDKKITKGLTAKEPGDRKIIGNSTPRYNYSLTGNVSYKGLDLYLFFQGVAQRDYWLGAGNFFRPGTGNAGSEYMLNNSWTPENTQAKYPTYGANGQNWEQQTGYLVDASYFRLKQVTLGYTLPKAFTMKAKVEKLRLYASGYNLFTLTDVPKVYDPVQMSENYPNWKSISVGAQITF